MAVEGGQPAPDFRLRGPGGQFVALSEFRGRKNVVLVFFPLAFSPLCSHPLPDVQSDLPDFDKHDAQVLGISADSHYANEEFARQLGLGFPLLSDFRHEAAQRYGVMRGEAGYSDRAVFLIDKQGIVRYRQVSPNPGDIELVPRTEPMLKILADLG